MLFNGFSNVCMYSPIEIGKQPTEARQTCTDVPITKVAKLLKRIKKESLENYTWPQQLDKCLKHKDTLFNLT